MGVQERSADVGDRKQQENGEDETWSIDDDEESMNLQAGYERHGLHSSNKKRLSSNPRLGEFKSHGTLDTSASSLSLFSNATEVSERSRRSRSASMSSRAERRSRSSSRNENRSRRQQGKNLGDPVSEEFRHASLPCLPLEEESGTSSSERSRRSTGASNLLDGSGISSERAKRSVGDVAMGLSSICEGGRTSSMPNITSSGALLTESKSGSRRRTRSRKKLDVKYEGHDSMRVDFEDEETPPDRQHRSPSIRRRTDDSPGRSRRSSRRSISPRKGQTRPPPRRSQLQHAEKSTRSMRGESATSKPNQSAGEVDPQRKTTAKDAGSDEQNEEVPRTSTRNLRRDRSRRPASPRKDPQSKARPKSSEPPPRSSEPLMTSPRGREPSVRSRRPARSLSPRKAAEKMKEERKQHHSIGLSAPAKKNAHSRSNSNDVSRSPSGSPEARKKESVMMLFDESIINQISESKRRLMEESSEREEKPKAEPEPAEDMVDDVIVDISDFVGRVITLEKHQSDAVSVVSLQSYASKKGNTAATRSRSGSRSPPPDEFAAAVTKKSLSPAGLTKASYLQKKAQKARSGQRAASESMVNSPSLFDASFFKGGVENAAKADENESGGLRTGTPGAAKHCRPTPSSRTHRRMHRRSVTSTQLPKGPPVFSPKEQRSKPEATVSGYNKADFAEMQFEQFDKMTNFNGRSEAEKALSASFNSYFASQQTKSSEATKTTHPDSLAPEPEASGEPAPQMEAPKDQTECQTPNRGKAMEAYMSSSIRGSLFMRLNPKNRSATPSRSRSPAPKPVGGDDDDWHDPNLETPTGRRRSSVMSGTQGRDMANALSKSVELSKDQKQLGIGAFKRVSLVVRKLGKK